MCLRVFNENRRDHFSLMGIFPGDIFYHVKGFIAAYCDVTGKLTRGYAYNKIVCVGISEARHMGFVLASVITAFNVYYKWVWGGVKSSTNLLRTNGHIESTKSD